MLHKNPNKLGAVAIRYELTVPKGKKINYIQNVDFFLSKLFSYFHKKILLPIGSMSRPIRSSFPELHPKSKGTARTLSFSISWAEKFFNVEPWPMYMYASISEKTLRISGKLKFVKTLGMIFF